MRAQDGQARSFSFGLSMSLSVGLSIGVATALLARPASAEVKLSPYADGGMMLDPGQSFFVFTVTGDGRMLDATPSAGVGLTKWLALDGSLGTLSTDPRARYHGGQAGLWFALVDTPPFELDFTAHATVFAEPGRLGPQVEPGVYAIVRAAHRFRLDVSAFAPITFGHLPSSSSPLREPVPGHEPVSYTHLTLPTKRIV